MWNSMSRALESSVSRAFEKEELTASSALPSADRPARPKPPPDSRANSFLEGKEGPEGLENSFLELGETPLASENSFF